MKVACGIIFKGIRPIISLNRPRADIYKIIAIFVIGGAIRDRPKIIFKIISITKHRAITNGSPMIRTLNSLVTIINGAIIRLRTSVNRSTVPSETKVILLDYKR